MDTDFAVYHKSLGNKVLFGQNACQTDNKSWLNTMDLQVYTA